MMKKMLMCAVLAAALAVCASAMAGNCSQSPDMTNPIEWPSQVDPTYGDGRVADDWRCTDGQPITVVKWWGDYHSPAAVVDPTPPAFQPNAFILRQYADNAGAPGALLNEALMPTADCNLAYAGSVTLAGPIIINLFSYEANLPAPWEQTKDSNYWLSVQAQYVDRAPDITTDGYVHWGWVSTPAGDFLGRGQSSGDGGATWTPIWIDESTQVINFAFEIGVQPVDTTANKLSFGQGDVISITADVAAIATPCYPFVRIRQPNDEVLYLEQTSGFVAAVTPYLGIETGPIALPKIDDFPILQNAQFRDMPVGTYYLESGAVDPVTTDINNLQYIGIVDRTALVIR